MIDKLIKILEQLKALITSIKGLFVKDTSKEHKAEGKENNNDTSTPQ